ncbi:uncharacterized protein LOC120013304 [Tripterygium wilfordii]|uniref:uncharacterized protein LOC120013304 n=1 Tax=Tripterygium wilfordii TaxID=458696 RepID=UPI0018F85864|nr:uncharacterized protein LOC120013304 [Tripterygium wilfordii]
MKQGGGYGHRKRNICLCLFATIVVIVLIIVILALTVFKAKRAVTTINSVSLKDLDVSLDRARVRVNLNVTVDVDLSIKNPNKVGFKFKNTSALLNYKGEQVGEVPIPADKISAGETKAMNLTLTIMADKLLSNSQVYSDVIAGELPLSTFLRISGKVSIIGIKVKVVSTSTCDFTVFVSNRTVGDQHCRYKTKL